MRWDFWNRSNEEITEVPESTEETLETEETEEVEDTLDDLDEETLTRVNARLAKERETYETRLNQTRESVRQFGFDFTEDQKFTISDPTKVQSHLSPLFPPQIQPPVPQSQVREEEEEEAWVSPDLDPDGFQKKLDKTIQSTTKQYQDHIARLEQTILSDRVETAMGRVADAVAKHAPMVAPILDHPEFEARYREALSTLSMDQWRDSRALARIAALLVPDLPPVETPANRGSGRPPLSQPPQRSPQETARAAANRVSLSQTAPSRSAGAAPQETRYSEEERNLAGMLGISVEEWRSLEQKNDLREGEDPYADYKKVRERQRQTVEKQRPIVRRG